MLTVSEIHTYYGDSHVLQGISLSVQRGEVVALLGRNGVGKSTTINSIVGFTPPREGKILLRDKDITRAPSHVTARLGVGLVPQGRRIFPTLSVRENITLASRHTRNGGWTFVRILETFPPLAQRLNNLGSQLSGGEQQMLAIARALMTNPELVLMDEPSEGLAPLIVVEIGRILKALREKGLSVLLVEQNLSLALGVANRVYVMNKGAIVFAGTPEGLRANPEILHRYLGV
ncbi:MAG: ABC transporter ATP-binding protein [Chloroflexi bacterium]|nr:ABC transporter ATP-binding protein [Chloroflexota bacterium]